MNSLTFSDSLSILRLSYPFTKDELKHAWRNALQQWHPDLFHNQKDKLPEATEQTQKINAAYDVLRNSSTTNSYYDWYSQESYSPKPKRKTQTKRSRTYAYQKDYAYVAGFPDATIDEIFVESSNLVSVGYNKTKQILYIKFIGNVVFSYSGVPFSLFQALLSADSKGKFAISYIYHKFQSTRHN